jgi:hypothetical protein
MAVSKRSLFSESAVVPAQGDLGAEGCKSPEPTASGIGHSATGDQAVREYRETARACAEGIHDQGASGLALPCAADRFSTRDEL